MTIKTINPTSLYDGSSFGMSQATIDETTGLIFVSGQVDWNINYEVTDQSIAGQTENAIKNLQTVLDEVSSSIANVLQLRVYICGELAEHMAQVVPILMKYLGATRPALTGIGVASLASPDTLIEIEAVAKVIK